MVRFGRRSGSGAAGGGLSIAEEDFVFFPSKSENPSIAEETVVEEKTAVVPVVSGQDAGNKDVGDIKISIPAISFAKRNSCPCIENESTANKASKSGQKFGLYQGTIYHKSDYA